VKIGKAVSENVYPLDKTTNQYGAGQGRCLAPLLWVMMSTSILRKRKLHHPNGKNTHERIEDTFVDDTSLTVTEAPCSTFTAKYQKITTSIREVSPHTLALGPQRQIASGWLFRSPCDLIDDTR
jgi:hypothetical protein